MKLSSILILFVVLIKNIDGFVFHAPTQSRLSLEDVTQHVVETIRTTIKDGDAELGIPVLDPYEFHNHRINYTGELFRIDFSIDASLTNGQLSGLADFQVAELQFHKQDIAIEFNLRIPSLIFNTEHYSLDGNINGVMPIKGQGAMRIDVYNITLWGKIFLKQSQDGKAILLDKNEDAGFNIESIDSNIQFDENIDAIINSMVHDMLADYLNRANKFISDKVSELAIETLNPMLEQLDSWGLITAILSLD